MAYDVKQTARRLLELREICDYSPEEVADKLGVSPEAYREIESGEVEISVGLLYEAANLYNVELTEILTGDAPKLKMYSVVKKGEGLNVDRSKKYKHQSLAYNFTHKKAEPFLVTVEPEDESIPIFLNTHPGQEMNYILEGSILLSIGGHEQILEVGDTIYFDSTYPHGMKARNGKTAKFLAVIV